MQTLALPVLNHSRYTDTIATNTATMHAHLGYHLYTFLVIIYATPVHLKIDIQ